MSPPSGGDPPGADARGAGVRWDGVAALVLGLAVNELTLEWTLVPDGEIGSAAIRLTVAGFQLLAVGIGLFVLARRPGWRLPWKRGGLAVLGAALAWFGCFAVLDLAAPGLAAGVPGFDYFSHRARYQTDSTLVMVPRRTGHTVRYELDGDLTAGDGLPALEIPYRASYNGRGFRRNGGAPPWDVVVTGDSFVEFGESDSTTVTEMLRRQTGLSTYNLGRGWYGPHQYVELLRRHGLALEPRFALLCFFEGNDVGDAASYLVWRNGGSYQDFSLIEGNLLERFRNVNLELLSELQRGIAALAAGSRRSADPAADGGRRTLDVVLDGRRRPMRFAYWPASASSPEELLQQHPWGEIREVMAEFRDVARRGGIVPVVVAIPTKFSTYAPFLADTSGARPRPPGDVAGTDASGLRVRALERVSRDLELPFLDLTPTFRRRAARGALLYYPQDTHWSPEGRRAAADTIGDFLQQRTTTPDPGSTGGLAGR